MGRLIDAEVVKKRLSELRFKGELAEYDAEIHNVFESVVDTTKTAYDVEKVVDELEGKIEMTWKHDYLGGKKDAFKEAIEVIRKGGIE